VTYKSEGKIFNCLNSIPDNIKVIVVENSNNKNFKKQIEESYPNVNCILTGSNKGYASANNVGLKKVTSKYALVLNPDTVLGKDAVNNFFVTIKKIKDFWIVGPGNDQYDYYHFEKSDVIEVNHVKGFAIFLNLQKFNNKYFDENYFLYFEEIDLCKTVKNNNGKIFLDKSIIIRHEGSSSVDRTNQHELEKNRNWHWMWSTFYFNKKHNGFIHALIIILPKLFSSVLKTLFYIFLNKKEKRDIYYSRLSGIINSIIGKKSWYRPSLD
tara:strand:- start:119 stop:922 length:804 start_codon:yes stop_codon:yes gene_type:complete